MKANTNTSRLTRAGSPVASACGVAVCATTVVLVVCVFFVFGVGSASARVAHGLTSSFGEAGSGDGQLALQAFSKVSNEVRAGSGIAVDTKDGLVFIADTGNRRVDVFTTAGVFVRAFGGDVGGVGVDVCTSGCLVGGGGGAAGELDKPAFVAVDETAGVVYVGEETDGWVSKFTLAGALMASWGEGGRIDHSPKVENSKGEVVFEERAFEVLDGVAVDGQGHLFVYNHFGWMFRFEPQGKFILMWNSLVESKPAGIVIRGSDVFLVHNEDGVTEFTAEGGFLGFMTPAEQQGGVVSGLGVDEAEGGLFVDEREVISQFGADCVSSPHVVGGFCPAVEQFGSLVSGVGVGVDSASHVVFVGDAGLDGVDVFDPVLEGFTSPASEVAAHGARLNGTVNPYGAPVTACRFEYGASEAYGSEVPCEETTGEIGSGHAPVEVHANLEKLEDATKYYYRLVVSNAQATVRAEGEQFTTLTLPAIDSAASEDVSASSVVLAARIDPRGIGASYRFEWGVSTAYDHTVPVPDASVGSGSGEVGVAQTVTGLSANTEYHWRVVASNVNGSVEGVDHTFVYDTSGGGLPDRRVYEMVTPPSKNAALIGAVFQGFPPVISEDGSRLMAASIQCFAGSQSCTAGRQYEGEPYLFSRSESGWSTTALAPPATQFNANTGWAVSPKTGMALFSMPSLPGGQDNYYVRAPDGSFANIGPISEPELGALGVQPINELEKVETTDFSHVVWTSGKSVWPSFDETKPGLTTLYEYVGTGNAAPSLVGVSGGPGSTDLISACGTELGTTLAIRDRYGSLSENGELVFFTARACGTGTGANAGVKVPADELWARVGGSRSVLVSARSQSKCSGACASSPEGAAAFEGASKDGSRVLFVSTQQLTDNASEDSRPTDNADQPGCSATTNVNGCNLYMFEGAASEDSASRRLVDVSAGDLSGDGPRVQGVMAFGTDGSHVYFVAKGVLTATANHDGATARNGANNLYVYERDSVSPNGHTAFIATLPESDRESWNMGIENANVTPDGRVLVFTSHGALTADTTRSEGPAQVYEYDAQTGVLVRVSIGEHGFNDNGNSTALDAEIVRPRNSTFPAAGYPRPDPTMSHDGSYIFFESPVGLTPQALNEVQIGTDVDHQKVYAQNVYEYHSGHVYLVSDGHDTTQQAGLSSVELFGSDASGANVFFTTADQLVPSDTDTQRDFYDARICTAASPCVAQAPPPSPPCLGEACHGIPAPTPSLAGMPTIAFEGQGNLTQASTAPATVKKTTRTKPAKCAKHKVRKRGKCVSAKSRKASKTAVYSNSNSSRSGHARGGSGVNRGDK